MLYLAMTAAEIAANPSLPPALGYMACHFSAYGAGLSNLPASLPEGSMLILNDRTPISGHEPMLIAEQLVRTVEHFRCSGLLLDFQRPRESAIFPVIQAILAAVPCPVAVSEPYAQGLSCPVFLPPVPLCKTLQEHLAPWAGREVWLEAALDTMTVTLTEHGSRFDPSPTVPASLPHFDEALCCHYCLELPENQAVFTLHRTWDDLQMLMQSKEIACCIGLYQELLCYTGTGTP